jgi:hypothetical protein
VKSWWWAGIPKNLGKAVVLGETYQALWPGFVSVADITNGLAFASTPDWLADAELSELVGEVPEAQAQKKAHALPSRNVEYPSGWPFGEPFRKITEPRG